MYTHKSKVVLFIVILVTIGIWVGLESAPRSPESAANTGKSEDPSQYVTSLAAAIKTTSLNKPLSPIQAPTTTNTKVLTGNPHYDQLSPEMQKALKDSLLLEGPKETYTRSDGSIVLPSNGRFTQMPVAVQMPDGTIKIQEYSNIPKPQIKLNTPK